MLHPTSRDDLDTWAKEMVERGEYLNDQEWVAAILEEQTARIRDLEDWGVSFERDERGELVRSIGMAHNVTRMVTADSVQMMETMAQKLRALGVDFLERTMVTGLLTSDACYPTMGSVVGAFGFDTTTGEPITIRARATVLATGGSYQSLGLSGDGMAQAFRAGAEVTGAENAHAIRYSIGHQNTHLRLGMRLVNAKGETFLESYYPETKGRVGRDQMALAVLAEVIEGRGPIYADYSQFSAEDFQKLSVLPTTADFTQSRAKEGIDLRRQPFEYSLTTAFPGSGGININIYGEATIPGLFAAGDDSGMPAQGTYSVGGVNLASCCVGGYRAGEYAARYAREAPGLEIKPEQVTMLRAETFKPLKKRGGTKASSIWVLWDKFLPSLSPAHLCVFRNEKGLKTLLAQVENWKKEILPSLAADDMHSLIWANKARNLLVLLELVFRSSLEREETRGNNIRTDFPYRDDINWLKWVILRREGDGISASRFPLPIYRWPVKPAKYDKIPYRFPIPEACNEVIA